MKLLFATNNTNKAHEIQELIKDLYQILSLKDIDCNEDIPEDQATIIGNAQQKAQYVYNKYVINVFADDTGLEEIKSNLLNFSFGFIFPLVRTIE